jgi:hypothetical protein
MKTPPRSRSGRFARYAVASSAALGAAAAAKAQFAGSYALTPQNGSTYGNWTASITDVGNGSAAVDIGSAPGQLTLSVQNTTNSSGTERIDFLTTAQAAGTVQFFLHTTLTPSSPAELYYTTDGTTFTSINAAGFTGTASLITFHVLDTAAFGFRLAMSYTGSSSSLSAQFTGFSAPTAIPEPGTSGLLAGCAAAGFVALMGVRKARQRAA